MKSHQIAIAIIIVIKFQVKGQERIESNCGRRLPHDTWLFQNEFPSNEGDWPWHAAIYHLQIYNYKYTCGGTVLNSISILTAAHCVFEKDRLIIPERVLVELGKYNLRLRTNSRHFEASKIIPHPNFSSIDARNNIAIIRLSTEATFNEYIQPICLWDSDKGAISEMTGNNGTVIGWADTENPILRNVVIPVVSFIDCATSNLDVFLNVLSDNSFCGGFENGTNVCGGYGGSSLSFEENGVFRVRGIVSLSVVGEVVDWMGSCKSKGYVLFTDVAKYLTWIKDVLGELKRSTIKSDLNETEMTSEDHGSCLIPANFSDTIKVYYEADTNKEVSKGSYVVPLSTVIYKCKDNYTLEGNTGNQCFKGRWVADHPVCRKYCSQQDMSGATITASCELFDRLFGATIPSTQPLVRTQPLLHLDETEVTTADHGSCLIPANFSDTIKVYYEADTNKEVSKGSYAVPLSTVIYKCKDNYTLDGNTGNQCFEGQWVADHPVCRKYCSQQAISGATITASCELFGETIPCTQPLPPQTIAHIHCALGYRKPDRTVVNLLKSEDDGQWDYHASKCEQICGEEVPRVVSFIVGGKKVDIAKVPWHVGIYSNIVDREFFNQICGGTIINAKVVISAAHCFWDIKDNRFYDALNFKVGAGKYYRDLNAKEQIQPQFRDVEKIIHKQEYIDFLGYYADDIALLILTDYLEFNIYIKPICLETDLGFNEKYIPPGLIGKVAGWGLEASGGKSSPELKYIDLPAIEYHECKRKLNWELQPFITSDKFCAGYTNGLSVCQGDSGGGFAYSKIVGGKKLYFLRGIVSSGGFKEGSCDNHNYSFFTNIQFHITMITHHESQNRPK